VKTIMKITRETVGYNTLKELNLDIKKRKQDGWKHEFIWQSLRRVNWVKIEGDV